MVVEFEEGKYGLLMMVLCDRWGRVYEVWISFGRDKKALVHVIKGFLELLGIKPAKNLDIIRVVGLSLIHI